MESTPIRVAIEGELTIFTIRERTTQLAQALATHGALEVDLAELTDFDTAGLQLLLLLQIEASAAGRKLRFLNPGPEVQQCLATLRLLEQFGLGELQ